jgi:hypothetical protein
MSFSTQFAAVEKKKYAAEAATAATAAELRRNHIKNIHQHPIHSSADNIHIEQVITAEIK